MESLAAKRQATTRLSLISEESQARQSVTVGAETTKLLSELGTVESKVAKLMKGSPAEMHREENLLHQAAQDALVAGEAKVQAKSKREHLATLVKRARALAQVRSNSTLGSSTRAEAAMLTYGDRVAKVAKDDRRILSEAKMVEQKVQAALKGKNASLSARVTKLLDMAQDKIREVASSEDHAAEEAREAVLHLRAQGQQHQKSSAAQLLSRAASGRVQRAASRQRAMSQALAEEGKYAAGEGALVKDGQQVLSQMSQLKGMVAQAFANSNSQGVEKAMEVGELLDKAREEQRKATDLNQKQATESRDDMKRLAALMPKPEEAAAAASKARPHAAPKRPVALAGKHPMALSNVSMVKDQQRLLQETLLAERSINASLNGSKDVRKAVFNLMEKARSAEQNILALEGQAKKQ
jgi:hypothetical protein